MGRTEFDCRDAEKFVHVYLDGEFDPADREAFEAHLETCERCRKMVRFEQRFKQAFASRLSQPPLPAGLEEKIREALDAEDARGQTAGTRRWWTSLAATAVVAALVSGLVVSISYRGPKGNGTVAVRRGRVAQVPKARSVRQMPAPKLVVPPMPQVQAPVQTAAYVSGGPMPSGAARPRGGQVSVRLVDPAALEEAGFEVHWIAGHRVYFRSDGGRSSALFVADDGRTYAVTAPMPQEELMDVVAYLLHQP